MAESFDMTELLAIFRSGLLALLPVMEAARIPWKEPNAYDPWEDIAQTLYSSIIGSCVENSVAPLRPLAPYGFAFQKNEDYSFISERNLRVGGMQNALLELQTDVDPFDTALLAELDGNLMPTFRTVSIALRECQFDLAGRTSNGIEYCGAVTYT
jgi:hypothetical protein